MLWGRPGFSDFGIPSSTFLYWSFRFEILPEESERVQPNLKMIGDDLDVLDCDNSESAEKCFSLVRSVYRIYHNGHTGDCGFRVRNSSNDRAFLFGGLTDQYVSIFPSFWKLTALQPLLSLRSFPWVPNSC